MLHLIWAVR